MAPSAQQKKRDLDQKIVAKNRRARFDYEILETLEAGMVLRGSEVKSIRAGKASIAEAYGRMADGEVWLLKMHVQEYLDAASFNHLPDRRRKLLLSKREIKKWHKRVTQEGLTIVPLTLFFNERGFAKIEIALAKGRKSHDKRQAIKKRETSREMKRFAR
ncbi:MAG: SsrA-binding protein SmpB [Planctomycetota bacterium]